ncbi:MAG: hypothetical protein H6698_02600 [Myxococcales bacterium]|nr:hypothetical protein [Myxococcales bacterium]MCB9519890.1 hypothetical protein [Myxococcales bacterium]MCB9533203.1 hypothetical protein [Myxococcales bacterium]
MSPSLRVFAASATRSLFLVALVLGAGCTEVVAHDLDERAANEVVVSLTVGGLAASKAVGEGETWSVVVPRTQAQRGLAVLAASGLPRPSVGPASVDEGGALVPSADEERARRLRRAESAVRETLLAFDATYDAHVHISQTSPRRQGDTPETQVAVVLLERTDAGSVPDDAIRAIVGGAIEGVDPAAVAIVRGPVALPAAGAPAALVAVGPLAVAAESAGLLRGLLGLASALLAITSTLALVAAGRRLEPAS